MERLSIDDFTLSRGYCPAGVNQQNWLDLQRLDWGLGNQPGLQAVATWLHSWKWLATRDPTSQTLLAIFEGCMQIFAQTCPNDLRPHTSYSRMWLVANKG